MISKKNMMYSLHRSFEPEVMPHSEMVNNLVLISPDRTDYNGPLVTYRFLSALRPLETDRRVDQNHLTTALKLSLPCDSTILESKERTAVYPMLQFCYGNYNVNNTKAENYTIQGHVTKCCLYREIRKFEPEIENSHSGHRRSDAYFIILGFKTTDTQALLESWKDWTGARHIYINFPCQLRLHKITLYRKESSDEVNLFNYIVKVECDGVDDKEKRILLLDFVQRLRAERTSNFCSLYEEVIT